ncbi:MAG TPA: rhodanese-like domain-containing protein [Polyangia bacterium]|jgi:rhodanese-related sulfurtransferase|nr:rhodanese-like domain-containing protein [Polyangia bacterium]
MVKRVTPPEAADLLATGWSYLDVRSIPEFEGGHPTGAANVPLMHFENGRMSPNPDFQKVVAANFPPDAKLVVGCKAGGRSLQAAALLEAAGYTSVVDMRGGFHGEHDGLGRVTCAGWLESKLPVSTTAPAEKSYATLSSLSATAAKK